LGRFFLFTFHSVLFTGSFLPTKVVREIKIHILARLQLFHAHQLGQHLGPKSNISIGNDGKDNNAKKFFTTSSARINASSEAAETRQLI
jgi:hypothetical protein